MRPQLLLAVAVGLLVAADDVKKPGLVGDWKVVAFEIDGKNAFGDAGGEIRLIVTADQMRFKIETRDAKDEPQFTYKTDGSTNPKVIDLVSATGPDKGMVFEGIYEIDGDQLRICLRGPSGVKERPTEFTSKDGMVLVTLKREK